MAVLAIRCREILVGGQEAAKVEIQHLTVVAVVAVDILECFADLHHWL
jgi:hypothetical protein